MKQLGVCIVLIFLLCSCSSYRSLFGRESELKRPYSTGAKTQKLFIQKSKLEDIITHEKEKNRARVVRVFRGQGGSGLPEYRLFGVEEGGLYNTLGLQNSDVLISGEEIAFASPYKFFGYVHLLAKQDSGAIEVRRGGEPVILQYTIID